LPWKEMANGDYVHV